MKIIYIFIFSIILFGCKKDTSPIIAGFTGIVNTDAIGNIINNDIEDWQPRWIKPVGLDPPPITMDRLLYCDPAYPNPFNPVTIISFIIRENANVKISIFNTPMNELFVLSDQYSMAGEYRFNLNLSDYGSGIYRVYIQAKSKNYDEVSFGDVQIIK